MTPLEIMSTTVISAMLVYLIKRLDEVSDRVDRRLDAIDHRLTTIEAIAPKRKDDGWYYSENSGIEM